MIKPSYWKYHSVSEKQPMPDKTKFSQRFFKCNFVWWCVSKLAQENTNKIAYERSRNT